MTNDRALKDRYFGWLVDYVDQHGYVDLLAQLHETPFVWVISNDVNRAEDGRELRDQILAEQGVSLRDRDDLSSIEASVLEVLAALADRASFQSDLSRPAWFQRFCSNLGLIDAVCSIDYRGIVEGILHDWMTRDYSSNGTGGLFPLRYPPEDQREVEIWYQMSAYLMEDMEADGFFD